MNKIIYEYAIVGIKQMFLSKSRVISSILNTVVSLIFPIVSWYSLVEVVALRDLYLRKIIINFLFYTFFTYSHYEYVASLIVSGKLNTIILRPHHALKTLFCRFSGKAIARLLFLIPIVIFLILFSYIQFHKTTSLNIQLNLELIIISAIFYSSLFFLSFFIGILLGSLSFWIGEIWPLRLFLIVASGALAGTWFPFTGSLEFLSYTPLGLLGDGAQSFLTAGIHEKKLYLFYAFISLIFITVFVFVLWHNGNKRYEANGG